MMRCSISKLASRYYTLPRSSRPYKASSPPSKNYKTESLRTAGSKKRQGSFIVFGRWWMKRRSRLDNSRRSYTCSTTNRPISLLTLSAKYTGTKKQSANLWTLGRFSCKTASTIDP